MYFISIKIINIFKLLTKLSYSQVIKILFSIILNTMINKKKNYFNFCRKMFYNTFIYFYRKRMLKKKNEYFDKCESKYSKNLKISHFKESASIILDTSFTFIDPQ